MVRWWWPGPVVEEAELARELEAMAAAGIGGVEVAFTSPVAPCADADEGFLSDVFLRRLRFAAERADALGLRLDLTLGSGWSFGGPHVGDDHAARCLRWDEREIPPGARRMPVPSGWPGDVLVAAYLAEGSVQEVVAEYHEVAVRDGAVEVPEGTGPRRLLLVTSSPTGQNVKRAAVGAEGPVLDHCSRAATEAHLAAVAAPLLAAASPELVTAVFCDSLEVYGADWTPALLEEFSARRGYDLRPLLWQLHTPGPASEEVRADVTRTLGELYEENFVVVVQRWAREHDVLFRLQSYGAPPATLSSYRHVDLPEGEGWGWRSVTQTKWATSAAHLHGRDVVSSETWTWVHSPSFAATPLDLKAEAHEHLLLGVNQLVGHGWPYSPAGAQAPGKVFYAAGALSDHNPWWPVMPELARYLQRLCWLLRQGEPVVDVALYAPSADATRPPPATGAVHLDLWRSTRTRIGEELPAVLRESGYDYDLVDDTALAEGHLARYRVVVLPDVHHLPPESARRLAAHVAAGGAVVAAGGSAEGPGWARVAAPQELPAALGRVVAPDAVVVPATPDVGVVHRRTSGTDVHLVVNTGPAVRAVRFSPRSGGAGWERWDPLTGESLPCEVVDGGVALVLHPYEAAVVVSHGTPHGGPDEPRPRSAAEPDGAAVLAGPWTVAYADAPSAAAPVAVPHAWESDEARRDYSGAAVYRTTARLSAVQAAGRVVLDLGEPRTSDPGSLDDAGIRGASYRVALAAPAGEVARVTVNGVACGTAWAPPFAVDVTRAVAEGENTVEVEVLSTAVAALRTNTEIEEDLAAARRAHGWRCTVQDLELARRPTASGLRAVPVLRFRSS